MIYDKGYTYAGEWKNDKYHGRGTLSFPDGSKYRGGWRAGKKQGQGTMTFFDGRKYKGEFRNDKYFGRGSYTYPDGWGNGRAINSTAREHLYFLMAIDMKGN